MPLDQLSPRGEGSNTVRVVIETTRGSRNKYSYRSAEGIFLLKKVLPEGHVFPFDFGFIPRTRGEDGDPLDVLVMMDEPAFPGCVVEARVIALLQARQSEGRKTFRNDRFVAVADRSVLYRRFKDVRDLTPEIREQVEHFFVSYNELAGKTFQPLKWVGARQARNAIEIERGTNR